MCQLRNAYKVTFKKNIELDIQEFLANQSSPTAFIKKLVRKEMERVGFEPTLTPQQAEIILSQSAYELRGLKDKAPNAVKTNKKEENLEQVQKQVETKQAEMDEKIDKTIERKRNFSKFEKFKNRTIESD